MSIVREPSTPARQPALAAARGPQQQLVEPLKLRLALEQRLGSAALAAPRDLHPRAERPPQRSSAAACSVLARAAARTGARAVPPAARPRAPRGPCAPPRGRAPAGPRRARARAVRARGRRRSGPAFRSSRSSRGSLAAAACSRSWCGRGPPGARSRPGSARARPADGGTPAPPRAAELLALDVLDERELEQLLVGDVAHDDRHAREARGLWPRASASRPR